MLAYTIYTPMRTSYHFCSIVQSCTRLHHSIVEASRCFREEEQDRRTTWYRKHKATHTCTIRERYFTGTLSTGLSNKCYLRGTQPFTYPGPPPTCHLDKGQSSNLKTMPANSRLSQIHKACENNSSTVGSLAARTS